MTSTNQLSKNIGHAYRAGVFEQLYDVDLYLQDCAQLYDQLLNTPLKNLPIDVHDLGNHFANLSSDQQFLTTDLTTTDPGLLMGTGYQHQAKVGAKDSTKEFKLGFYFDPTTGVPILPGSTVKGRLRSFFPARYAKGKQQNGVASRLWQVLSELAVAEKLSLPAELTTSEQQLAWLIDLEYQIFAAQPTPTAERNRSATQQDRFFEAYPCSVQSNLFAVGTITPHGHPLRNPVPINFLKVSAGVTYRFQWLLNDDGLPAKAKHYLFERLLELHGIGAKTASSFGQFARPVPDWVTEIVNLTETEDFVESATVDLSSLEKGTLIKVVVKEVNRADRRVYLQYGDLEFDRQFSDRDFSEVDFIRNAEMEVIFKGLTDSGKPKIKLQPPPPRRNRRR